VNYFDLAGYYKTIFFLTTHKQLSLTEIEELYPWEYDIYLTLLKDKLESESQRKEQELIRKSMG